VFRIYINTDKCYCPLPKEIIPFCEEGKELGCRHYRMAMQRIFPETTKKKMGESLAKKK
jgi:hypothetical protein